MSADEAKGLTGAQRRKLLKKDAKTADPFSNIVPPPTTPSNSNDAPSKVTVSSGSDGDVVIKKTEAELEATRLALAERLIRRSSVLLHLRMKR